MSGVLPAAAAAFWGGLLLWEVHPSTFSPWMALAAGAAALGGSWLLAPRRASGPGVLADAGLVAREPPATEAVAGPRVEVRGRAGPIALGLLGMLAIGGGWGGLAGARLDGSLMGRLVP
ncbi:MAG: hypothetical protein M3O98_08475, partial [Actinomycetota bacterium]|nr:hypothetical protein [Actinomycetota bacterium]